MPHERFLLLINWIPSGEGWGGDQTLQAPGSFGDRPGSCPPSCTAQRVWAGPRLWSPITSSSLSVWHWLGVGLRAPGSALPASPLCGNIPAPAITLPWPACVIPCLQKLQAVHPDGNPRGPTAGRDVGHRGGPSPAPHRWKVWALAPSYWSQPVLSQAGRQSIPRACLLTSGIRGPASGDAFRSIG